MNPTRFVPWSLAVGALLFVSPGSWAGPWQWRDAQGRMVFSDRAPPADVLPSQILRSPEGGRPAASSSRPSSSSAAAAPIGSPAKDAAGAPPPAQSWVERERAFRQRIAEREENAAKERDKTELAALGKRACDDARSQVRTLESGVRVVTVNARGEPEPLDDSQRANRLAIAKSDVARLCAER
ncbi:MAG: DUF4124 domain-containing protein [Burkholderiaceae bacterium]|nr:DUF4124 domain-containing protein [Burkholderiaceae bacterium]